MIEAARAGDSRLQPSGVLTAFFVTLLVSVSAVALWHDHPYLSFAFFLSVLLAVVFYFRPMTGVYLLILIYPIQGIILVARIGLSDSIRIYLFQLVAVIMLVVLISRKLAMPARNMIQFSDSSAGRFSWIFFLSAMFLAWSAFPLLWTENTDTAQMAMGLWKQNSNFVLAAYLIVFLDDYSKLRRAVLFSCAVALLLSVAAIYSTWHEVYSSLDLYQQGGLSLSLQAFLINSGGDLNRQMVGLINGQGLTFKHGLGLNLAACIIFCLFLMREYSHIFVRMLMGGLIVFFAAIQFMTITRASVLGMVLCIILTATVVLAWRKYLVALIPGIAIVFFAANFLAARMSATAAKSAGTVYLASQVAGASTYQPGTAVHRLRLMGYAVEQIKSSWGLGGGPDIMNTIPPEYLHSHNMLLSFGNDYGIIGIIFALGIILILVKFAWLNIFSRQQTGNRLWLLRCTLFVAMIVAFFEYQMDLFIWFPQIWFLVALFLASMRITDPETAAVQQGANQ